MILWQPRPRPSFPPRLMTDRRGRPSWSRRAAEPPGLRQKFHGADGGALEVLFEIGLRAAARKARNARGSDRLDELVARPVRREPLWLDVAVEAVPCVDAFGRELRDRKRREVRQRLHPDIGVVRAVDPPFLEFRQLRETEDGLDRHHPPVGAHRGVQPAKAGRVILAFRQVVGLAVILETPGGGPERVVVRCGETSFSTGRNDLVLAERERCNVAEGADRRPLYLAKCAWAQS